jgi:tetrahydromethanopterin S-methyltransferase subunit F
MKRSRKAQIKELLQRKESCRWDIAEIHSSDMDPDIKALYLNDVQYKQYCIEQEIERLEEEEMMFPLKLMLAGFIVSVVLMFIYLYLKL